MATECGGWWLWWLWCGPVYMTKIFVDKRQRMHLIGVAEHLGASSRRPRHPQALDNEELFVIEG